jgi:DNA ligase (NAD+)
MMSAALLDFNYKEIDDVVDYAFTIQKEEPIETKNSLEGLTFCITGKVHTVKNRDELKTIIENNGGKVVSSMSSKVNYLINNDITSTSSKNKTAKDLGIPIITEEDLQGMM